MPAKTERQRRFMAMCYTHPDKAAGKCPSKEVAHEFMRSGKHKSAKKGK